MTILSNVSRHKPACLTVSNLNKIVKSFLPVLEAEGMEGGKTVLTALQDIPDTELDEKEIRQLILNLVKNGLEAMEPGKSLTIETCLNNSQIVLAVRDEGSGIPKEMLDKIGVPFVTTKEKGTGLGLQVCYSIAARHNATIDFKTGPTGTTFFVRFKAGASFYR